MVSEVPIGARALDDVAHRSHDDLGTAHAEGQREPFVCAATVQRPNEVWARAPKKTVERLIVVASDHNRTPGREAIEERGLNCVEVLILINEHDFVSLNLVRMRHERLLDPEHRIVKTHGVVVVAAFQRKRSCGSRLKPPHQGDELRNWTAAGNGRIGLDE
jgi:hypothetical protein